MAYDMFTNFTPAEIEKHIGVYTLNGLSPSPDIKMKFSQQKNKEVNKNDAIYKSLGSNTVRHHKDMIQD
eukprot:997438-Ditylum_brightwellii.AAC.2